MSPVVSRQPVTRTAERPFAANLARIMDSFRNLDPRLMNSALLGLAALAAFSFAVTFIAGSRTSHPPQRGGLPLTPVAERASDVGPAVASRFEPIRTLPDLLPAPAVAPAVVAPRPKATARRVTRTPRAPAPTSSSRVAAPRVVQPVRRRIVTQPRTPVARRPSTPAPAPQTFDSSGDNSFDSSG
jgi:hypothetical protein